MRLLQPTAVLLAVLVAGAVLARLLGADPVTVATAVWLALIPAWFLVVTIRVTIPAVPGTSPGSAAGAGQDVGVRQVLERLRLVVFVAVAGLVLTTVITLGWALFRTGFLVVVLVGGGWAQDTTLISLLEVIDLFLLATVQVIVALGLYELFVDDLTLPPWLTVHSLNELKRLIVEVLVVILGIKFLEWALASVALDALYYGVATALVIAALVAFTKVTEGRGRGGEEPSPVVRPPGDRDSVT